MIRQAVLMEALDLHPIQVTVPELVRLLVRDPHGFSERDEVERAVAFLGSVGLLHAQDYRQPGVLVTPTQAAFVANDLLLDEGDDDA
jgi:hypothetical protein